jgi:YHYH protein
LLFGKTLKVMSYLSRIGNRKSIARYGIVICLFLVVLLITTLGLPAVAYKPSVTIDLRRIPIGDGRISTQPQSGFLWSCRTQFGGPHRHGAHATGNWIHPNQTYDLTTKPIVNGSVYWAGDLNIALKDRFREIVSNRLPQDPTGNFPISPNDDAYAFDRNPNSIRSVAATLNLPANPRLAATPSCVPMGQVGILLNGGYLFNALDANGKDAVAHEIQDSCQGHPEHRGTYHYHSITSCLNKRDRGRGHSALLGYALDGFGIYGHRLEGGKIATNNDLDVCHGHTHELDWDGQRTELYHYHATWEYPYTIGCYRGTPVKLARPQRAPNRPPEDPPEPPSGINSKIGAADPIGRKLNSHDG